jgi:hypothetical protein
MRINRSSNARHFSLPIALAAAIVTLVTGCSSSTGGADGARPNTQSPELAPDNRPQRTPEQALEELLSAERRGDFGASYAYVVHAGDGVAASESQWRRARGDLPRAESFTVKGSGSKVIASVEHQPALDPFVGLVPARERQTWSAVRVDRGWLLKPQPRVEPEFAPETGAVEAAGDWYRAVQRCDQVAAERVQGLATLFDTTSQTPRLCGVSGPPQVETNVRSLPAGPISGDIVAQYSNAALQWGRVVRVTAPVPIAIVLAPLGNTWKVIGVSDLG